MSWFRRNKQNELEKLEERRKVSIDFYYDDVIDETKVNVTELYEIKRIVSTE